MSIIEQRDALRINDKLSFYIKNIDEQKLNEIIDLITSNNDMAIRLSDVFVMPIEKKITTEVNLSSSGMAYTTSNAMELDQHIAIVIELDNTSEIVYCIGTIVESRMLDEKNYYIRILFKYITEVNCEKLIAYTHNKIKSQLNKEN
jgi:hypothetical protein